MANKNNGSDNGNGMPEWAKKTLEEHDTKIARLEGITDRLDAVIRLQKEELKKHDIEIAELKEISKKLSSKSDRRDEILADHSKAIKILLRDLKGRSKNS